MARRATGARRGRHSVRCVPDADKAMFVAIKGERQKPGADNSALELALSTIPEEAGTL
jgi:hypothetical protein